MVVSCSICGEQYGVTEDVTFHKFPANEERRKKWLNAVQRSTWTPGKRSMVCSKHFSQDEFVYKISRDKVRRYLIPDAIPMIFDRTKSKANIEASRVNTSNDAATSNVFNVEFNSDQPAIDVAGNSNGNLNLEILAATSVALEPHFIATEPGSILEKKYTAKAIPTQIGIQAVTAIEVPSSSSNYCQQKRLVNFSRTMKRAYHGLKIQTDSTLLPKRSRQVYPGDFKKLNYNDVTEVSKSWTVLNNYIKKMRTNMKVLRQRNRRLEKRVTDLKSVVKFLKNRIVAKDSADVRLCGSSELPMPKKILSKKDSVYRVSNPLIDHNYVFVNN